MTNLFTSQLHEQAVGHKLNVALHQFAVHTNEGHRQCFSQEFLLYDNSITHYLLDTHSRWLVHQMAEHEAGKVCVQALYRVKHAVPDLVKYSHYQFPKHTV